MGKWCKTPNPLALRMLDEEEREDVNLDGPDDDEEALIRFMEAGDEDGPDADEEALIRYMEAGDEDGPDADEEALMRFMATKSQSRRETTKSQCRRESTTRLRWTTENSY
jgi:hypothetical protein